MGTFYHVPIMGTMIKTIASSKYQKLIQHLKKAREASGLTMREVGAALEQPHSFIQKVEMLERRLDVHEYVEVCKVLNVDPHEGIDLLIK